MAEEPTQVVLRPRDVIRQAWMFGAFAAIVFAIPAVSIVLSAGSARFWPLLFVPIGLLLTYLTLRLVTARVVLDERGVVEPRPLRSAVLTPWTDLKRTFRTGPDKSAKFSCYGVGIEHSEGWKHQLTVLYVNTRDPGADHTVNAWVHEIKAAKKRWGNQG